jgi:hypothetical protein
MIQTVRGRHCSALGLVAAKVGTPVSEHSAKVGLHKKGGVEVKHHLFLTLMPRARWCDWLNVCASNFSLGGQVTPFDSELIECDGTESSRE